MLSSASTTQLVDNGFAAFSISAMRILGYSLTILVALLVCYWGWHKITEIAHDQSARIGGFYLRKLPYAGYRRFRSRKWNMEHMQ